MIEATSCHFCSSRCGMLVNVEDSTAVKLVKAPCESACPVGIDVPRYMRFIGQGRFAEALSVIGEKVPLPGVLGCVCNHPCEKECQRGESDEALAIRALKKYVAEHGAAGQKQKIDRAASTGKKVAIVGSGPAGLTAGYYLARLGHAVTVFEALPKAGGMMRVGIPAYRLPRALLDQELESIKSAGVEIKTNSAVESIDALLTQGYSAVFVATGAHRSLPLNVAGEENAYVKDCVSFLSDTNLGQRVRVGDHVAVVGGGFAAVDAARSARRLGARDVTVLYRRTRDEMLASAEEVEDALAEGVNIQFLVGPSGVKEERGKVKLECVRMRLGMVDASGRRRPERIPGSEFSTEFDTVIAAVGQRPDVPHEFGLDISEEGAIRVTSNLATSRQGVFAGGDAVSGPASVVEAIAAGRDAARAIDRYLGGTGNIDQPYIAPGSEAQGWSKGYLQGYTNRLPLGKAPAAGRIKGFDQVELGFDADRAMREAERCLWCDLVQGNPDHLLSHGWSCKRGRADTARRCFAYQY